MRTLIASVTTAAALALGGVAAATPAHAADTYSAAGCPTRTTSQMLSGFGDTNEYFELANGTIGSSTSQWSGYYGISGENEPWYVNSADRTRSISLWNGDYARTPSMCLAAGEETFRFFYKGTGQYGSKLTVKAFITSDTGNYTYTYNFDASQAGWKLSPTLSIPMYSTTGTQQVTLQLQNSTSYSTSRPVLVDDVLVDPWRARGI